MFMWVWVPDPVCHTGSGNSASWRPFETSCAAASRSEEHTSELQSQSNLVCRLIISEEHTSELRHSQISYAVFCLKKKKTKYSIITEYGKTITDRVVLRIQQGVSGAMIV